MTFYDMAIGAIMIQERMVIVYDFRLLNNVELKYQFYEHELLAIIHALIGWHHNLLGSEFEIKTSQQLLRYLTNQANIKLMQ